MLAHFVAPERCNFRLRLRVIDESPLSLFFGQLLILAQ